MMHQLVTRTTHRINPPLFTMTKLIRLLSLILLLSGARVSAQTQVVGLRDFKHISDNNRGNPEGYYFEDRHHDLDKFVGEWEGTGFGDHQWRAHIIVQKRQTITIPTGTMLSGWSYQSQRMVKHVSPLRTLSCLGPHLFEAGDLSGTERRALYN